MAESASPPRKELSVLTWRVGKSLAPFMNESVQSLGMHHVYKISTAEIFYSYDHRKLLHFKATKTTGARA